MILSFLVLASAQIIKLSIICNEPHTIKIFFLDRGNGFSKN